jgi:hypothetical protein
MVLEFCRSVVLDLLNSLQSGLHARMTHRRGANFVQNYRFDCREVNAIRVYTVISLIKWMLTANWKNPSTCPLCWDRGEGEESVCIKHGIVYRLNRTKMAISSTCNTYTLRIYVANQISFINIGHQSSISIYSSARLVHLL